MEKIPLSVCIVTHNEEKNIRDCLESVKWASEIVVIDDFSDDKTVEICKQYFARVISHTWQGHVEQKNFCLQQASRDWILSIDADERVSPELREEIFGELENTNRAVVGYWLPRKTYYLGRWITRGGWYPNYQLRLFEKHAGKWGGENPHDRIALKGQAKHLKGDLYHYTYKDIADHLRAVNSFTDIAARVKQRKNVKFTLAHMLINPLFKFFRMYILKRGFMDGTSGFIVAIIGSFYVFLKYAKLWEINRND